MEAQQARQLKQALSSPEKHEKAITKFKETYEGLQIGPFNFAEIVKDVIDNSTANIEKTFKDKAIEQLEKSGIQSPLLKANLVKSCDEVLIQFSHALEGVIQSVDAAQKKNHFDSITARQMKVSFMGISGNSIRFANENVKRLQIGIGAGFVTECSKTFDFEYSKVEVFPTDNTWYIYAKVNRESKVGSLVAFTEPQPNTDEHFFILWQSGTFKNIKI